MSTTPKTKIQLKAKLLCEGFRADEEVLRLFAEQNPSGTKRGGLSSGGKFRLEDLVVNAPLYRSRETDLFATHDNAVSSCGIVLWDKGECVGSGEILSQPAWYNCQVDAFPITQIFTAHNRQLAAAVYEDCALFGRGDQCQFCVINRSLRDRKQALVHKRASLFLSALEQIPRGEFGGLTLNGGMTTHPGRGFELLEPVVRAIHNSYPDIPIAVEMTPPADEDWVDRLVDAGVTSLMMNLEAWDEEVRKRVIPGKQSLCPRDQYLRAFKRSVKLLGPGRTTTCFVVGTESNSSLREGIAEVIGLGVIPSPLAGRYFEDVPNYPFSPSVNWEEFLDTLHFAGTKLRAGRVISTDRAGCVACGMCDLIKDI